MAMVGNNRSLPPLGGGQIASYGILCELQVGLILNMILKLDIKNECGTRGQGAVNINSLRIPRTKLTLEDKYARVRNAGWSFS